jgi:hypothetical protein
MASAALPPADARHADADVPGDCSAALTSALAAVEASLLAACTLATPSAVTALSADGRALLRRVGTLSVKLCALDDALMARQHALSGADGGNASGEVECLQFSSLPHSLRRWWCACWLRCPWTLACGARRCAGPGVRLCVTAPCGCAWTCRLRAA